MEVDLFSIVVQVTCKRIVLDFEAVPGHLMQSGLDSLLFFPCVTAEIKQTGMQSEEWVIDRHHGSSLFDVLFCFVRHVLGIRIKRRNLEPGAEVFIASEAGRKAVVRAIAIDCLASLVTGIFASGGDTGRTESEFH